MADKGRGGYAFFTPSSSTKSSCPSISFACRPLGLYLCGEHQSVITMKKLLLLAAAACLCWGQAAAQKEGPGRPLPPDSLHGRHPRLADVPNPEEAARAETDCLKEELQLTEKQYKKVYKLNLKAQKERLEARFPAPPSGMPMPPGEDRRPPMPEGGFPPMMGEGRPPMPPADHADRAEQLAEQARKREKKMKKILTDEQFARWKELQARSPRPRPEKAEKPGE